MLNQLEQQNQQLTREVQNLRKQLLENEITKLTKLASDNLSIGQDLLVKGVVENINAYLENNQRIERKITEHRQELTEIEQQLTTGEQVAQIITPAQP